jgi:large subunit ribosomal protein L3
MKGKNLPGHMGHEKVTIQNLKVVGVDVENQLLLISGSVPGPKKGLVIVRSAVKSSK